VRTFTEKSFDYWSEYVCSVCKHLTFSRQRNTWVCGLGHRVTKEYCADWVKDIENIRIRMADGYLMHLSEG
jgi:hypothetical protein